MADITLGTTAPVHADAHLFALATRSRSVSAYRLIGKRMLDVIGSFLGLVLLSPVLALIAVAIAIDDWGWPLYLDGQRVGLHGSRFRMLKFRSMFADADQHLERLLSQERFSEEFASTGKLRNDPRVTRLGRVLRRSSIDELPQLINVLVGHMSLVGPRPVTRAELLDHYGDRGPLVTHVRPGLTGLWQTSGRSNLPYVERVAMDCAYAAKYSFELDLAILRRTIRAVISGRGAY